MTRAPSDPLHSPAPGRRTRRAPVVLAAILVGALVVTGAALATDRLKTASHGFTQDNDPDADSDHDGLPDAVEQSGFVTKAGDKYVTNPKVADSDHDGLTDGEEAGAPITRNDMSPTYIGISNPLIKDTDDDGVRDGDEYFLGTNPRSSDTDNDRFPDEDELHFGSDPLVDNPDGDAYSDAQERERGSAPLTYDKSGWQAAVSVAFKALNLALFAADKVYGRGRLTAVVKAIKTAKAASVAAPMIWSIIAKREWSNFDKDKLLREVFGDDVDKLGKTLEGGRSDYVAYVGRDPGGELVYVGVTDNLKRLTANHGGLNTLHVVGGSGPMPLGQARALAEAVINGPLDRIEGSHLKNTRHLIDPANSLYAPALKWGSEQLKRTRFQW